MLPPFSVLMGGGIPRWALGADIATDYQIGRNYAPLSGLFPPGTDTHGQTIYANTPSGVFQPFAANIPVITGLGLQNVPTRTNLLTQSQSFDTGASWTLGAVSVTANQAVAPDGTTTADLVTNSGASAQHVLSQAQTLSAVAHAYSVYAKMGTSRYIQLRMSSALNGLCANFDLQAGAAQAVSGSAPTSQTIEALGNGWYRCTIVSTALAASGSVTIYAAQSLSDGAAPTNTEAGTYYLWQAQLEVGAFASPPIPTTGSSATVNGNQPVISGLSAGLASGVAGIVQFNNLQPGVSGGFGTVFSLSAGTGGSVDRISFYRNQTGQYFFDVFTSTVSQAAFNVPPVQAAGQALTFAFVVGTNYAKVQCVGQADIAADTTVSYPAALSQLNIGVSAGLGTAGYQFTKKVALSFLSAGADMPAVWQALLAKAQLAAAA